MRRLICGFLMLMLCVGYAEPGCADDFGDVLVLEFKGQQYFYQDIDKLESVFNNLIKNDACMQQGNFSGRFLMDSLLHVCRGKRAKLTDLIKSKYGQEPLEQGIAGKWGLSNMWDFVSKSKQGELEACVINLENLTRQLNQIARYKLSATINTDLDACIRTIDIDPMAYHANVCPANISVENAEMLANLEGLNSDYRGKSYTFMDKYVDLTNESREQYVNVDAVLIYNGHTLVACQNGVPQQMGRPVFSGYEACRGTENQDVPNIGELPDGIYLLDVSDLTEISGATRVAWGTHRVPLNPSVETNTHGRNNFYLHGTSDAEKHRSAGCISLGTHIGDFVTTDWFKKQRYIMVIVKSAL